jgi:hypothetical protein
MSNLAQAQTVPPVIVKAPEYVGVRQQQIRSTHSQAGWMRPQPFPS